VIEPRLEDNGQVTVDMGVPAFAPAALPFLDAGAQPAQEAHGYWLRVDSVSVNIGVVSMGNPHAVQVVDAVDSAPVTTQGVLIEQHAAFPKRVNAGYMEIVSPVHIRLRVYERGAGETLACGTGACAAVVTGVVRGLLAQDTPVRVSTRGGDLQIRWAGAGAPVLMTGPAVTVFEGAIDL
jgi:diaminopimelate epimerase